MSLESEVQELTKSSNEQTAASQELAQEVAGKMAQIDQKVNEATTVVRNTIRDFNAEQFFVNSETGNNDNDGKTISRPWRDLSPLKSLIVYGKTYKISVPSGQTIDMPVSLVGDNVSYHFQGDYNNPGKIRMMAIDYQGTGDGTVFFGGINNALRLYGVKLETATRPPESTGKSTTYNSSALDRNHGGGSFYLEMYQSGIIIKDFPFIRNARHNAGFVTVNLGYNSGIEISEGGELYFAITNDHLGLSNGISSSIDNKNGDNTWKAITYLVGGNSNVVADFDFDAQV
ncbi:hypothetical protein VPHZ6_orf00014 [Vibrio phage VPHZ6]|nr:hypothetical protein VPHZ6_orf00014 [Vibrio phage VPHZ6]